MFPRTADPIFHKSLCLHSPITGLCPKTLHLNLVIPLPEEDSIQVLPAVSFRKRERYQLSYWGRALFYVIACLFLLPQLGTTSLAGSPTAPARSQGRRSPTVPCTLEGRGGGSRRSLRLRMKRRTRPRWRRSVSTPLRKGESRGPKTMMTPALWRLRRRPRSQGMLLL